MYVEAVRLLITLLLTAVGYRIGLDVDGVDPARGAVVGAILGAGIGYVLGGVAGRFDLGAAEPVVLRHAAGTVENHHDVAGERRRRCRHGVGQVGRRRKVTK